MHRSHAVRYALIAVLATPLSACTTEVDPEVDSEPPDLFACGVQIECVRDHGHLGGTMTTSCGNEPLGVGEPGVLLETANPGPDPLRIEALFVVAEDGTGYRQSRSRCEKEGECAHDTTTWRRFALEHCTSGDDWIEGCFFGNGQCLSHTGCVPVPAAWTCSDLPF